MTPWVLEVRAVCEWEKVSREPISTKSEPIGAAVRSVRLWSIVHSFVEAVVNNAQLRGALRVKVKLREANTDESPSPRTENVGSILERDLDATIALRMGVVKKDGAYKHRMLRREPGYTFPMLMEQSRILQGNIFKIRKNNLPFSRCQKAPARRHPYRRRTGLAIETGDFRYCESAGA